MFQSGGVYGNMTPMSPAEEQNIRDRERARVQAQIDAVTEASEIELADARQRGASRLGRNRALAANTGELGNPNYDRRAVEVEGINTKERRAIEADRSAKIGQILGTVDERAASIIEKYKTEARTNADKFVQYLADVATQSRTDMLALATAGAELSVDQRNKLIEQTGYDAETFDQLYQSMRIANSDEYINKNNPEIIGNQAVFFKQSRDPKTGKISLTTEKVDLPENTAGAGIKQIVPRDDGIYVIYDDGSYKKMGEATTSEKKRIAEGTEGDMSGTTIQSQFSAAQEALKNARALSNAAGRGRSWLEQKKQGIFGATDYTNLEAYANTLRTNVLALATDPNVKKFFGPQMSNADVQLLTAAGTSLNPELQGPDAFGKELDNLEKLFTRLATAKGATFDISGGSGGSLKQRAEAAGYDYDAMKASNYSDDDIEAALNAAGQ